MGLKARRVTVARVRLESLPLPSIIALKDNQFHVVLPCPIKEHMRLFDPRTRNVRDMPMQNFASLVQDDIILVTRRIGGAGFNPNMFGFAWFIRPILRYRRTLAHVLLASLCVQIFALITTFIFQLVIDKVLVHKNLSTLDVLMFAFIALSVFDLILQYLRSYLVIKSSACVMARLLSARRMSL